ncbi:MAG: hypothetical protein JNK48_28900 [Bryobacterales bacterium]|nr:hypothetical protein [Bryobacterales bacterium]
MFESHQKHTGTRYTMTAALLLVAFVFSPAIVLLSRPVGIVPASLAIACSVFCIALAWVNWKWYSELTVPSIEDPNTRAK